MNLRRTLGQTTNYILHYGWITCILIAMLGKVIITIPWWGYYMIVIVFKGESNVFEKTVDYMMRYC